MGDNVEIVYQDHAEFYVLSAKYTNMGEEIGENGTNKFDPYREIEMINGNGGRQVRAWGGE